MPRYRITISSRRPEAIVDLVNKHKIEVSDHGQRRNDEVGFLLRATVTDEELNLLRREGYVVVVRTTLGGPS